MEPWGDTICIYLLCGTVPPHVSSHQEKLHLLCPVRALKAYVHRSLGWRSSRSSLPEFCNTPKLGLTTQDF